MVQKRKGKRKNFRESQEFMHILIIPKMEPKIHVQKYRDDNLVRKLIYQWCTLMGRVFTRYNRITNKIRVQFSIPESDIDRIRILVYPTLVSDQILPDYTYTIFKYVFMLKYNMNI